MNHRRGDLVEIGGRLAVVVGLAGDPNVPEEHVALWFGPASNHQPGESPEIWTVPEEYCVAAAPAVWLH